jgi:transglutaminase-like putative cysteine protease
MPSSINSDWSASGLAREDAARAVEWSGATGCIDCQNTSDSRHMKIKIGFDISYHCFQPTPMIVTLSVHSSRIPDLLRPDELVVTPSVPVQTYRDGFGNTCSRILAPMGEVRFRSDAMISDPGTPDPVNWSAQQWAVADLPDDTLVYLLGSRYCETDRLSDTAWALFGDSVPGWGRVQAICDFVHRHITFGYQYARHTRTAWEAFHERQGVCRDFAHLAVAFCRCMNFPARYCTGYLGDIGVPVSDAPMDFSGWFEAFVGGRWYTFDARHNIPRIGRVLIATGRDASDVAISTTFGPSLLKSFRVWTDEVTD